MTKHTAIRASSLDVDEIVEVSILFFHESDMSRYSTVNEQKYRTNIMAHIDNPFAATFIVRDQGRLVGYIHTYCQDDYTDEMIGEVYQMYVAPEYRGKGVSRVLTEAADMQFKKWGCVAAFCEVSSGIDSTGRNNRLFVNLWKRIKYQEFGIVMFKRIF